MRMIPATSMVHKTGVMITRTRITSFGTASSGVAIGVRLSPMAEGACEVG